MAAIKYKMNHNHTYLRHTPLRLKKWLLMLDLRWKLEESNSCNMACD